MIFFGNDVRQAGSDVLCGSSSAKLKAAGAGNWGHDGGLIQIVAADQRELADLRASDIRPEGCERADDADLTRG